MVKLKDSVIILLNDRSTPTIVTHLGEPSVTAKGLYQMVTVETNPNNLNNTKHYFAQKVTNDPA